jgi:starvation-inducible DNA-binding protein
MNASYMKQSSSELQPLAEALNGYLADIGVMDIKLHNLHWNVEGRNFFALHEKLEEFYEITHEILDDVAERVLTIGFRPLASLKDFIAKAGITELPSEAVDGDRILDILVEDFIYLLGKSREILELADSIGDQGSVDLMAGYIAQFEKTLWMLNATR